ncbi:hypothetical protein PYW08_007251 [Mythimna loreyi]|uniref:Uncharacterized protein n=1 Tax=Mythimna loreyi TaxID=667449 RepID=A0ACC2RBX7_9NEOP|nr:hypothetical protein PYW08_007251 [Mythimna loreyi]
MHDVASKVHVSVGVGGAGAVRVSGRLCDAELGGVAVSDGLGGAVAVDVKVSVSRAVAVGVGGRLGGAVTRVSVGLSLGGNGRVVECTETPRDGPALALTYPSGGGDVTGADNIRIGGCDSLSGHNRHERCVDDGGLGVDDGGRRLCGELKGLDTVHNTSDAINHSRRRRECWRRSA